MMKEIHNVSGKTHTWIYPVWQYYAASSFPTVTQAPCEKKKKLI